jgi:arabinogalactan oligomer/maltooligosaccharide transport system permease protein
MIKFQMWMWLVLLILVLVGIFVIYTTKRFIPAKYLFPGVTLLCLLLVVPIVMTVSYSFTNYGDGSRGTKQEMIDSVLLNSVTMTPDSPLYNMTVAVPDGGNTAEGPFTLFLIEQGDDTDTVWYGADQEDLAKWDGDAPQITDHRVMTVDGYQILNSNELNKAYNIISQNTAVGVPDNANAGIKPQNTSTAFQGQATITYDEANDQLVTSDGKVYKNQMVGDSQCFVDASGSCFQGRSWLQNVGWKNYTRILTDSSIRSQFLGAFGWTLTFALGSVILTFIAGFFLAVTLNDDRIKAKKLWRSFLLLPYAVPSAISLLIWSGFFNPTTNPFGMDVNWFGDTTLARIAVFIVQLWMGFPYMFIVCTGALQSIPNDVKEAAAIDGSTGISTNFRIILPLLLVAVAPLMVSSFAFNFNNFNAIQLLTQGAPAIEGQFTRGGTDILISMIYKQAFGGSGTDFGFASAVSVLLFILTGIIAAAQFQMTKKLENLT